MRKDSPLSHGWADCCALPFLIAIRDAVVLIWRLFARIWGVNSHLRNG